LENGCFCLRNRIEILSSVDTLSSESYHETPTIFGVILATRVTAEHFKQSGNSKVVFLKFNFCIALSNTEINEAGVLITTDASLSELQWLFVYILEADFVFSVRWTRTLGDTSDGEGL